jgi:hypothetical protein
MATGSGAQTLDSQSPLFLSSIRKRSRSRPDPSTLPIIPKKKKEKEDDILDLTVAFHQSIQARKSNITRAVEILAKEYETRLSEDDFDTVVGVLSDESKASAFLGLPKETMKDRWLEKYAHVLLL